MEPRVFYLGFNLVPGIGPARLQRLIDHFGSVQDAWHASALALRSSGLDPKTCESLLDLRQRLNLAAEYERVMAAGAQIICLEDPQYPRLLREIPQPPPMFYLRGSLSPLDETAIAVVGTRHASSYGREATRRIVSDLAQAQVTIVSGLALGIDSVAHQTTLDNGGRTIAVLGSGVDQLYPERNRALAEQIMQQGAIISEYPLGTVPAPLNFPPRNRLISGLSIGTLVIEAGERSGALITTEYAAEQGREVFCVPGTILSQTSIGTHRLIRNGATLVTSAQDILEAIRWTSTPMQQSMDFTTEAQTDDPAEAALLRVLRYEPQHIDELGWASGLSAAQVAAALMTLELRGAVRATGGMNYVKVR